MKTIRNPSTASAAGVLTEIWRLLSSSDRRKLVLVTCIQILFGVLDLLGVALIGMVSALALRGARAQNAGDRVGFVLEKLNIDDLDVKNQILILSAIAVLALTAKTIFSLLLLRKVTFFLSRRSAELSGSIISKLLNYDVSYLESDTKQQRLFAVTSGVTNINVGILTTGIVIISDLTLLIMMSLGLFIVNPLISLVTASLFASLSLTVYFFTHVKATRLGKDVMETSIKSNQQIIEAFSSYREIFVKGGRQKFSTEIKEARGQLSNFDAEIKFLPNFSKYVTELGIVVVILMITLLAFQTSDSNHAIGVVTVFMAASTRIAPAIMRLQLGVINVKSNLAAATPTLKLLSDLREVPELMQTKKATSFEHIGFRGEIEISDLHFKYPNSTTYAAKGITASISEGELVGLVGTSGSGKTTLVDLILGILVPERGSIRISGIEPLEAIIKWPGAMSYVPQNVFISNSTIRENVSFGFDPLLISDEQVWEALELAELSEFVAAQKEKLGFPVGENGNNLSGGQKQRLGIARGLISKPRILILDEATSSLDSETENLISETIQRISGRCTVITIAHRLSTVRHANSLYYLEDGEIKGEGTFEELKQENPNFLKQTKLMGL